MVLLETEYNYVLVSTNKRRLSFLNPYKALAQSQKLAPAQFIREENINFERWQGAANKLISLFMPGPFIAIISDTKGKIAVQVSDSPLIKHLLERIKKPLYFIETEFGMGDSDWLKQWRNRIGLYVEDKIKRPRTDEGHELEDILKPFGNWNSERGLSTIIDLTEPTPVIIRKGIIPILEIEKVLNQRIKLGTGVYFNVLFVCSGNSCRSPIAKGILEKMLTKENVFVYSAGTTAESGNLPSEFAVTAARKYGADISHYLSAPLTKELINSADLILTMSPSHKKTVIGLAPKAKAKTFLLKEYAFGLIEEIEDPIGQPLAVFERVAKVINESLKKVAKEIKERYSRFTAE